MKGFDRVFAGGFSGRIETEQEADPDGENWRDDTDSRIEPEGVVSKGVYRRYDDGAYHKTYDCSYKADD